MTNSPGLTKLSVERKGSSLCILGLWVTRGQGTVWTLLSCKSTIRLLTFSKGQASFVISYISCNKQSSATEFSSSKVVHNFLSFSSCYFCENDLYYSNLATDGICCNGIKTAYSSSVLLFKVRWDSRWVRPIEREANPANFRIFWRFDDDSELISFLL